MKHQGKTIIIVVAVAILALVFLTDFSIPGVFGEEQAGVEITVHFTDGSHEVFGPQPTYGIVPLTILVNDKPIEYIEYRVMVMLTWEGNYQWLRTGTNMEIYLQDAAHKMPLFIKEGQTEDTSGTIISGEWFCAYGPETIHADTLNFIMCDLGLHGKSVQLTFKPTVTSAMLMADQTTAERTGSAQGAITVVLEEQAESVSALNVQIWSDPFF